jgi:MFS transporter, NNP family, nitrate/nitrite transporter
MTQETLPPTTSPRQAAATAGRGMALALATIGFAVNFWAWSLLSPLAPHYQELLGLSPLAVSVMVAVPVIVGSLGRIPLGALTDRYGGRIVFAALSFVVIAPVLFLAFATSYPALLLGGLLLGLGGASFAVGVPFVNAWFPPERRGVALGVYGIGNIGTAISGFVTPRVASSLGRTWAFLIVAVALAAVGLAFLILGRDAPNRPRATEPFMTRFRAAARLPIARDLAVIYAITFGGFVAFGVYLPTFLKTVYGLETTDAATRAAGFVVLATLARPVGGWLADRVTGVPVLKWALGVVAAGAVVTAFQPPDRSRHRRLPDHGGRPWPRQWRRVRAGWHPRPRGQRRQRHRPGRRGRRARRLPPPDRDGPGLPGNRRLRDRPHAAQRRRPGRAGVHRMAPRARQRETHHQAT